MGCINTGFSNVWETGFKDCYFVNGFRDLRLFEGKERKKTIGVETF